MNKYKVVVYAIAKNEAKFADAWAKNMSEADEIYVLLDPTSTDNTKEILEKNGVNVVEKLIRPWRFDKARNESLKLVPKDADICVCTDIDELFVPGWRKALEEQWQEDTNQAGYNRYQNAQAPEQTPNYFEDFKIHDRNSFEWKWIIHEYLVPKKGKKINCIHLKNVELRHYPDVTKFRPNNDLLAYAVKTEPKDPRYLSFYIEALYLSGEYDKLIEQAEKFFTLKNSDFQYLGITYKFLALAYKEKKQYEKARNLCLEALMKMGECKYFYGELGAILIDHFKEYELSIAMMKKCLKTNRIIMPARESDWQDLCKIYNYMSVAYHNLQDNKNALFYINLALEERKDDQLCLNNKAIYLNALKKFEGV